MILKVMSKIIALLFVFVTFQTFAQSNKDRALKPIKENFNRINSQKNWTKIDSLSLIDGDSFTQLFYTKKVLEKFIHTNYGETGKRIAEYYFLNQQLSFVLEQEQRYNMTPMITKLDPVNYPEITELFDPKKTSITEVRSYFSKGKLIRQDARYPKKINLITEEKNIKEEYKRVKSLTNLVDN
jgi:hypothetical protein